MLCSKTIPPPTRDKENIDVSNTTLMQICAATERTKSTANRVRSNLGVPYTKEDLIEFLTQLRPITSYFKLARAAKEFLCG